MPLLPSPAVTPGLEPGRRIAARLASNEVPHPAGSSPVFFIRTPHSPIPYSLLPTPSSLIPSFSGSAGTRTRKASFSPPVFETGSSSSRIATRLLQCRLRLPIPHSLLPSSRKASFSPPVFETGSSSSRIATSLLQCRLRLPIPHSLLPSSRKAFFSPPVFETGSSSSRIGHQSSSMPPPTADSPLPTP